jgi:hypothetical protein
VKVIVPPASLVAPTSVEVTVLAVIAEPAMPFAGADAVMLAVFVTAVEAIPLPHTLAAAGLLASPL